jgi:hypothetical protein
VRPLRGGQPGQLIAAGHEHHAVDTAGQQRTHLFGVVRVVEHEEHPLAGQQTAVQPHLRRQAGRELCARREQRLDYGPHRLGGRHRRTTRVIAAQVDVQLAVREAAPHAVRPVHRQSGLAHARGAVQDHDRHPAPATPGLAGAERVQLGKVAHPPGEGLQIGRQLLGYDRSRLHARPCDHRVLDLAAQPRRPAGQQVGVDPPQLRRRIHPQLLGQADPHLLVPRQRHGG